MAQRQRARYRVPRYIIVNNVTTATLESKMKNAWKRHWQKRNGNSLNSLYLGISNSFKDDSSKLNNHSAMAVGKFILALSVQFEFCFLFYGCLPLDFVWKWYELNYKNWQLIFFISLRYEWKKTDVHIVWRAIDFFSFLEVWMKKTDNVHIGFFIHTSRKRKKINCQLSPPYNVHVGFFIHTSRKWQKSTQGNEKNQQSILKCLVLWRHIL